jgi:hypothetical protein
VGLRLFLFYLSLTLLFVLFCLGIKEVYSVLFIIYEGNKNKAVRGCMPATTKFKDVRSFSTFKWLVAHCFIVHPI